MSITAARTLEIVTRYGVDVAMRTYASKTYDAATGLVTLGTATDHSVKALAPYQSADAMKRFGVPDGVVEASAFSICSPSGLSFTPAVGMEFTYGGRTWVITAVNPIQYKTSVVLYELALKASA